MRAWSPILTFSALLSLALAAFAGDGRPEINQACAVNTGCFPADGPGFPVTIGEAGSYRLTGNLKASVDLPIIEILTSHVDLDLAGFEVQGIGAGVAVGIVSRSPDVAVRRGTVRNMGAEGIRLDDRARVDGVSALFNGDAGIVVGAHGLVNDCHSAGNGGYGLDLGDSSGWAGNSLSGNNGGNAQPQARSRSALAPPVETGVNICGADSACLLDSPKLVFVTSELILGSQPIGLGGADGICAARASQAGFSGTFLAWLGGPGITPPALRFSLSTQPYVRVDGAVIANDWADLTDGELTNPINLDETGAPAAPFVWSGVTASGASAASDNCEGWVVAAADGLRGQTASTSASWTDDPPPVFCASQYAIYCFQQ